MAKCKVCENITSNIFTALLLNKYNVRYYQCRICGYVQTEEPYWLNEAYESPINLSDTGLVQRNIYFSQKVSILLYFFLGKHGKYLDYAAGYGMFVRLMRDIGFNFYWHDPFTKNIFARGFEYKFDEKVNAITTFESFEHFVTPKTEIERILQLTDTIIFSTELMPDVVPGPNEWWYYCFEHGQHIGFYQHQTLQYIAKKYSLNFYTNGKLHLFSKRRINPTLFKTLLKLNRFGLNEFIKIKMNSRTDSDMNEMIKFLERRNNENSI